MENIDISKILKEKKEYVIIVMIMIFAVFIAKNIYGKQMVKYNSMKEQIATEQQKNEIVERIVLLNEQKEQSKKRSWNTADFNMIVERIFNLGLENNVKIRDISPGGKRDETNYVAVPFTISGEVTYRDLLRFIKRLETYPTLLHVKGVSVSPVGSQAAEEELVLGIGLAVEAFYLK